MDFLIIHFFFLTIYSISKFSNKNMRNRRNTIRLNESMLKRIIKESVKRVLREGIENEYRVIACLTDPVPQCDEFGRREYRNRLSDYLFISDETNDFKERVNRLKKYKVNGGSEYYSCDDEYIIDDDDDDFYLMQLQPLY